MMMVEKEREKKNETKWKTKEETTTHKKNQPNDKKKTQ